MTLFYLKVYLVSLVAFLTLDAVWLGVVARGFYRVQIGFLITDQPRWGVAFVFYAFFVAGLLAFVVLPGQQMSLGRTVLWGALFGLVTYATYDLTNLATVRGWPWLVSIVDMAWGACITAAVSAVGHFARGWFQ